MSNETHSNFNEEISSLDTLKEKLKQLEKKRGQQNSIKSVGILIVLALVAYISFSLYSIYHNFDSDKFTKAVGVELETTFKPRLENLHKKSEADLLPLIEKTAIELINKKIPEINSRLDNLVVKIQDLTKEKIEASVANMLKEIEDKLNAEIGENELALILDNDEFEDIVAEELYRVIDHSEEIVENFRAEIEFLKLNNPAITNAKPEEAEKIFLLAILDLLKYGVDPELGKVKMGGK